MRELLEFLITGILGDTKFSIEEVSEKDSVVFKITLDPEKIGLLVGREGKTIKAIQNLVSVRARLENKDVFVTVS